MLDMTHCHCFDVCSSGQMNVPALCRPGSRWPWITDTCQN